MSKEAIVCVDDEPLVLRAMSRILSRKLGERYEIEMATNGAEALELIEELDNEQTSLRMVVSDAMMPVMDGYELIRWLHENRPRVPKIIVTGYGQQAKLDQLREEAGLLASFDKPWEPDELVAFIRQTLEGPDPDSNTPAD
ncbi:MAG: response regulator [Myxococcota bacterium]